MPQQPNGTITGSASIHIEAPIDVVWDLVSVVTRVGEFSPETFEAERTEGATGPALGARFRGHVKRNQRGRCTGRRAR